MREVDPFDPADMAVELLDVLKAGVKRRLDQGMTTDDAIEAAVSALGLYAAQLLRRKISERKNGAAAQSTQRERVTLH